MPRLKLEEPEGHGAWSLITLELQIYSIRHLQQHTGELMERLGARTGAEIRLGGIGCMPEQTSTNPHVTTWLNHIRTLAVDIGPRGPTRPGERQGALYAQGSIRENGLATNLRNLLQRPVDISPTFIGQRPDAAGIYPVSAGW